MALDLTGIQNVGEFYSHHYLDALLDKDLRGLFDKWRLDDTGDDAGSDTPDKRLNRCANDYFKAKSQALNNPRLESRYQPSHQFHVALLEALGYSHEPAVCYLLDTAAAPLIGQVQRDGHPYLWIVETCFTDPDESPLDNFPLRVQYQYPSGDGHPSYDIPRDPWETILGELFRLDQPPRWLLFLAGRFVYLIDRTKWGQGQYLLFDLDEIFGRRQRDTLRAAAALLSRDALLPEEGVPLHDTLDENSHKHAYGVSTDLKYGVRRAVELLANEYVWYQRNIGKQALFTDEGLATALTRECLTYLYRLLFLFYAEARSSELGLVPMQAESYRTGYSLEALRDLEQVPLHTPQAQNGYFINESLNQLFRLVNDGFPEFVIQPELASTQVNYDNYGFTIAGLRSPLFAPQTTPRLSAAKFRNVILQEVLQLLSLSREGRSRKSSRGRISYAQLGINQLGAVYEGLLSYTGFFAHETLYEVKPAGTADADETGQTYFIPESDLKRYEPDEFVYEQDDAGQRRRKRYEKGSFIFRLAGRDREKSASYYTPEVLTQCVVKYSLKELLGESPDDPNWKTADEILQLLICEPAMGSGAFINEAINQLADAYLTRKQAELGETLPPDAYRVERQKVKAHLALHNAYGVDLNPMAAELAQVSIWLNTIYPGMPAPWFNARFMVGNSLIGARRQVYSAAEVLSGDYANQAPTPIPLNQSRPAGTVYHWLLPDKGMAAFDNDVVIKELAPDEVAAIKAWHKEFTKKFTQAELKQLQTLSDAADDLWQRHARDRQAMLDQTRTPIPLWGKDELGIRNYEGERTLHNSSLIIHNSVEARQATLDRIHQPTTPYRRLKLAMDYWCALWFWPIPEAGQLPSRADFLADMAALLIGPRHEFTRPAQQLSLLDTPDTPRQTHLGDLALVDVERLVQENRRLKIATEAQRMARFHHWELTFAEAFLQHGGFNLIVGNPPWVKLQWNQLGILSDFEPYIAVKGFDTNQTDELSPKIFENHVNLEQYLAEYVQQTGLKDFLGRTDIREVAGKIQTNLYVQFIMLGWQIGALTGVVGFLHDQGLYSLTSGELLRTHLYKHLRYYFHFHNELKLFRDVDHTKKFEISILKAHPEKNIRFVMMVNLFHPITLDISFNHDGQGSIPGIKNSQTNTWELRGHQNRIVIITEKELTALAEIYEDPCTRYDETRLPQIHSSQILSAIRKLVDVKSKLGLVREEIFYGIILEETKNQRLEIISKRTERPQTIRNWVISSPQFYVATPFYQEVKENYRSPQDYEDIDLTKIPANFLPRSIYQTCNDFWDVLIHRYGESTVSKYHLINRKMALSTFERTLITAIMPPYVAKIDSCFSTTYSTNVTLCSVAAFTSSIVLDFLVKTMGKLNIKTSVLDILPIVSPAPCPMIARVLRLNCLTEHYSELWENVYLPDFCLEDWTISDARLSPWNTLSAIWSNSYALRTDFERRQALIELDVLAAMELQLSLDELITIYSAQFPVLQKNELRLRFDQRGAKVPIKTLRGELVIDESHPDFPAMIPPFTLVNRESDYRQAWAFFEQRLKAEKESAYD